MHLRFNIAIIVAYILIGAAYADEPENALLPSEASLDQLVGTKIYTASKKEEDVDHSPSADFILTAEDIKQMGVRHVADALRAVPGLEVAKISSDKWMVASRGFGEQFSNKLLVLLDGRPLFNTLFSGVQWYQEDIPILDIERIEVIRGPGATLWGSNAVNGVINIITKPTSDTLGTKISTTFGIADNGNSQETLEAQNGQKIEGFGTVRTTLKLNEDPSYNSISNPSNYNDSWKDGSVNFRYDSPQDSERSATVTGSVFNSQSNQTYTIPTLVAPFTERYQGQEAARGGYLSGAWTHDTSADTSTTIRSYIDYTSLDYAGYKPEYGNASLELQRDFILFNSWRTVAGADYKITADNIKNSAIMINSPSSYVANYFDAFFQTKIPLVENNLYATIGNKIESNSYDSLALSPSIKLSWEPTPLWMTWLSWSQAHRTPSRNTDSLTSYIQGTPSGYIGLIPNSNFKSENLNDYEAGIRVNPFHGFHLDTSLFYNHYNDLRTFDAGAPLSPPVSTALYLSNSGYADNNGIEISGTYQTSPALRLNAGYTHTDFNFGSDPDAEGLLYLNSGKKWANDVVTARASYRLSQDVTINASAYYYSAQPAISIPAYTKVDSNLNWSVTNGVNVIAGVDNLTDNEHPEYSAALYGETTEVPRLYYVTLELGF